MKIGLVTSAFLESTLPLYKRLSQQENVEVELIVVAHVDFLTLPSLNLENFTHRAGDFLDRKDVRVLLSSYLDTRALEGVRIYIGKGLLGKFVMSNRLINFLLEQRFNALLMVNFSFRLFSISASRISRETKILWLCHEVLPNRINDRNAGLLKKVKGKIELNLAIYAYKNCSGLICLSKNERLKFESLNLSGVPVHTVSLGPFEKSFLDYKERSLPNFIESNNYILFVGYLRSYKGIEFLLESIANHKSLKRLTFVFAGRDEIGIRKYVFSDNIIVIDKFLDDQEINNLMANCRACIIPYQTASQSGIPLLASAFRKPIIASNIDGINEYVENGENGVLFEYGDQISLLRAIEMIEDDKFVSRIKMNYSNDLNPSIKSWNEIAKQYLNIFQNLF